MDKLELFDAEKRFLEILWAREPVKSTELARICQETLGWKKPTTFNMIRKLADKHLLKNENATVTALISREDLQRQESEALLQQSFQGSVPAFLAAFLEGRRLKPDELEALKRLIEEAES